MVYSHFDNFKGNWLVNRKLGKQAIMYGNASFELIQENLLYYKESGIAIWNNYKKVKVSQKYIYKYDENEDKISVYFSQRDKINKLFYTLDFNNNNNFKKANAKHICNLDTYFAEYLFINNKKFELIYNVRGPKKKFEIKTLFRKINQIVKINY